MTPVIASVTIEPQSAPAGEERVIHVVASDPSGLARVDIQVINSAGVSTSASVDVENNVAATDNTITLTNRTAAAVINYPLQFGRPFMSGEIRERPQVLVAGVPIATQVNIKNTYPDGSVKFAVISVVIPNLPPGAPVELTFRDEASNGSLFPLTKAQMLALSWDADMTLAGGTPVSARAMLEAGAYKIWAGGQIAQTIELADDTGTYDLLNGVFRPRFILTFWSTGQVRVRFVGEAANPQKISDLSYSLTLRTGGVAIFTQAVVPHNAMSRWTKTAWIGGTPDDRVDIDHNLAYLSKTKFIPNYDAGIVVPEADIAAQYTAWQGKLHTNLYDRGLWNGQMPTGGARPDIGPYPNWAVLWLYTGDWRMRQVALGSADLSAAWPWHLRESVATKHFAGRTITVKGRPTLVYFTPEGINSGGALAADKLIITGPLQIKVNHYSVIWYADGAHQPDPCSVAYTLTGDPFYLDEMYLSAGWSALRYQPKGAGSPYDRGPTGAEGYISDEVRGDGWVLRNRAQAAFLAPDDDPEKEYFTELTYNALGYWEGQRNVTGTALDWTPHWAYGKQTGINRWKRPINCNDVNVKPYIPICAPGGLITYDFGIPPKGGWETYKPTYSQESEADGTGAVIDRTKAAGVGSLWMQNYLVICLHRVAELGFHSDALLDWAGAALIGKVMDTGSDPYTAGIYTEPLIGTDLEWFESGAEKTASYKSTFVPQNSFTTYLGWLDGYPYIAIAAAAGLVDYPRGRETWDWLRVNVPGEKIKNLKWMIVP